MATVAGDATPVVRIRSLSCPSCGATVAVRSFGHAVNVVCQSCRTLLDANDAGVKILQQFKDAIKFEPLVPLGTRGKIANVPFEVIGFQIRQIEVDGTKYRWAEYLLFNPYQGFRYLTEYAGHWNLVSTLHSLPSGSQLGSEAPHWYGGQRFRHFQTSDATTIFVLGEFPWQVRVGEQARVVDYVAPPRMLSAEITADREVTWSMGQYTSGADVWKDFALPSRPPAAQGIFADQPSPFTGRTWGMWRYAGLLVALAALVWLGQYAMARQKQAFVRNFTFDARTANDVSLVTPTFDLDGSTSSVRLETTTDLENQWMYLGYALINDETGQTFDFGREVSYYHGYEDGESWTEGSRADAVTVPRVPPGRYFLRIEPEGDRTSKPVSYRVAVIRDVPTSFWFFVALALLAVPPILTTWRSMAFETRRWQESDHSSSSSSDDD
jgi:hypothetical protein